MQKLLLTISKVMTVPAGGMSVLLSKASAAALMVIFAQDVDGRIVAAWPSMHRYRKVDFR